MKTLLLLLSFPFIIAAQSDPGIDSLKKVVAEANHDTTRINALKALTWKYYFSKPEAVPQHAQRMIEMSQKAGFIKGQWDAYNILGVWHCSKMQYDSAIHWLTIAQSLSTDRKFIVKQLYTLQWLTNAYGGKAEFSKAEDYAHQAIALANTTGDPEKMARAYRSLAGIAYDQGSYHESLTRYFKADSLLQSFTNIDRGEVLQNISQLYHILENKTLEKKYLEEARLIYKAIDNAYGLHAIELSLGDVELQGRNYRKAGEHYRTALAFFENYNDDRILANCYRYLGRVHFYLKEYRKALPYYEKAIALNRNNEGDLTLASCYKEMGDVLAGLNNLPAAYEALATAYAKALKLGDLNTRADILKAQAALYERQNNFKKAYAVQQQAHVVLDSLNALKRSKAIIEVEARYQNEKKEKEIQLLAATNRLQKQEKQRQQIYFIVAIVTVLLIAFLLYLLFRTKLRTAQRLKELDELKSRFFANISHEFRTPLTLIAGPIENRLRDASATASDRAEWEMVSRNSRQLLDLVDQLLELSKIEAGGLHLRVGRSDIFNFLSTLSSSFRYAATSRHIDFNVNIPPVFCAGWFDRDVVQKITINLLSNAFKYTPDAGRIRFEVNAVAEEQLTIAISNSGAGIPEKSLKKIFDRFYQESGTAGGIGIGLALVKELVESCGGTITATSASGETTFKATLPLSRQAYRKANALFLSPAETVTVQPVMTPSLPEAFSESETSLPVLLIVEDNSDIRTYIRRILQKDYTILEAADGTAGIAIALEQIPDLIISDVMMPDTDGLELCRILKTDERTSHIPIILLTAKAGEDNAVAGLETGADDYLTKPFSSDRLMVRIRKLIELRKDLHERFSKELVLKPKTIVINSTDETFLTRVQQAIDKNLTDSNFNAETFAFEVGMSRMQLHRKLKGLTGLSANTFIRSYRLRMAADLLSKADANISDIGYAVGFSDPSYFSKCFRETYHCTPSEYAAKKLNTAVA